MKSKWVAMIVLGLFSVAASASPPTDRGYRTCEEAILSEFGDDGVVPDRTYFYQRQDDKLVFFMNGFLWNEAGERVAGRATCYTTANGRNLIEFKAEFGRYGKDGNQLVIR